MDHHSDLEGGMRSYDIRMLNLELTLIPKLTQLSHHYNSLPEHPIPEVLPQLTINLHAVSRAYASNSFFESLWSSHEANKYQPQCPFS